MRYDRADEVLEACFALWNGWEDNAFVLDKKAGVFADPSKVHYANYEGRWDQDARATVDSAQPAGSSGDHAGG